MTQIFTPADEKIAIQELSKEGYSSEEIQKIIQGHKEVLAGKGVSAEKAYKQLLAKEIEYA